LAAGSRSEDYAEGILEVCRQSLGLRLACVAGVTGSDLRKRVEAIMRNDIGYPMTRARKWALALVVSAIVLAPVLAGALGAQSQLVAPRAAAFEEVSLRRHAGADIKTAQMYFSGDPDGRPGTGPDGRLQLVVATNVTAHGLLRFALPFDPKEQDANMGSGLIDIENAPGWTDSDRFDLVARAPERTTQPQLREMLLSLLMDRFKLRAHRGLKEIPIYALFLMQQGAPGAGLIPSRVECQSNAAQPSPCGIISATPSRLIGRGVTMAAFAKALGGLLHASNQVRVDRRLVDRTGLSGTFDFTLEWRPDPVTQDVLSPNQTAAGLRSLAYVSLPNAANFLAALEQQLGLVLVSDAAAEPALIIDEIELPMLD
jgi:uncharacterized protein (TIGR03435 family)